MGKKKIIGIVVAAVVAFMLVGVGIWWFLGRTTVETGGNRLGVEWYDVNGTEFTITTADQLYELAELSNYYDFKDQTIKLGADIVVNEGNASDWAEKAPARKWSAITGFGGVFDGQGHTISGLYAKGYDAAIALFINTMSGAEIKDFKLTNTYFESAGFGGVASIASNGGGKFKQIYSDAILAVVGSYSGYAGGICSKLNLQTTIEECWYDGVINTTGRDAGGIVDNVLGSRVTISHSLFSGEINGTWDYSGTRYGGLVGRVYKTGAGLVLNDSLSTGKITSANVYYTGSVVGASMGNTSLTSTDTYGSQGSYDVSIGRSGANGTINSSPLELREKELIGAKAYQWTNLDFNKYWAIVENDTPILQHFAEEVPSVAGLEKAFDTSWYTEGATEFVITDLADLYGFYFLSASNTFSGKTIKVGADIVINEGKAKTYAETEPEYAWYPVMKFGGTFDGQGHTISGLYLNTSGEKVGFFKETTMEATVKNLSLKNSYMINTSTANVFMGGISGRGGGTFDTIYSDAIMVSYGSIVGGIFGQVNAEARNTFTNCWFDGSIALKGEAARYVGGIAGGAVKGNTTFAHCLNTAPISSEFKDAGMFVGGITGYIINEGVVGAITDCFNAGKITVDYHVCVGAIIGRSNKAAVTISDTYATTESYTYSDGSFRGIGTASSDYTGGVVDFSEKLLAGYGGYQWTTLNFKDYWTVVTGPDGTPILKSFANKVPSLSGVAKMVDTSWYSADKKSFVLKDLADLYGFYIMSGVDTFEGKTVKLGANIVVNAGNAAEWANNAPANPWFPIKKFAGTFDGQGHTISGAYLKTDKAYTGLFAQTTNTSTVKNLRLENSYFESTIDGLAAMGSIAGQMGGTLDTVYSNAIVVGAGTQIGGLVGRVNQEALMKYKMTNCWFDGSVDVHVKEAAMSYVGGLMGGIMNGLAYNDDGSLKRVSEWNVSDSMNAGLVTAGLPDGAKMPNNSTFANGAGSIFGYTTKGTVNMKNVYATTESCITRMMQYNTKTAVVTGAATKVSEASLLGTRGYQNTLLDFDKYWAARSADVPALKSFAGAGLSVAGLWKPDVSWYDDSKTSFTISTLQQLYGLVSLANSGNNFAGKTINLGASIDLNNGWTAGATAPQNVWTPIEKFAGTFNGQGNTISGVYVKANASYAGLFAQTTNTSTIKNLSIKNSYFTSTADGWQALGSVAGQMGGTLEKVYSEAIVVGTGTQIGGLVGRANQSKTSEYKMTECWFNGSVTVKDDVAQMAYIGGLVGVNVQGILKMDNCLNSGTVSYIYDELPLQKDGSTHYIGVQVGGLIGGVMNGVRKDTGKGITSEAYITDSMNAKRVVSGLNDGSRAANGAGSIFGYTTSGTVDMKNVYAVAYSDADVNVITRTHSSNGKQATVRGSAAELDKSALIGTKGYQNTMLDFDKYWSARENEVPALKTFVGAGLPLTGSRFDTSWLDEARGTATDPYIISNLQELYGLAYIVNSGDPLEGKTVKLADEITVLDLNEGWTASATAPKNVWAPIGSCTDINSKTGNYFAGTFDGNNKTIRGLYVNETTGSAGLFGYTVNSTIRDLRIENSYMTTTAAGIGSIAGYGEGMFDNIYVGTDVTLNSSAGQVGGIIGRIQDGSIKTSSGSFEGTNCYISNCWFAGSIVNTLQSGTVYVGGLVGAAIYGTTTINNSVYSGSIECATAADRVGGILGSDNGSATAVTIKNSVVAGTVTGGNVAGSVIGLVRATTSADSSVYTGIAGATYGTDPERTNGTNVANISVEDFTATGKLDEIITALNANVATNNINSVNVDWRSWVAQNGIPVLGDYPEETEPTIDVTPDTTWYTGATADDKGNQPGTAENPYVISTPGELYGLATLVNEGTAFNNDSYKDKVIVLANNIKVNNGLATEWEANPNNGPENSWTPIGDGNKAFYGVFDGQGYEINGLFLNTTGNYVGLFGYSINSTVKNLSLKNTYFKTTAVENNGVNSADNLALMGSIMGHGEGTLDNVYSDAILVSDKGQVGGLIGRVQQGFTSDNALSVCSITNCWFAGKITCNASTAYTGGIVGGVIRGNTTISNSLFSGEITCASGAKRVGGILGSDNNKATSISIRNSVVTATSISGSEYVASVVGFARTTTSADSSVYVAEGISDLAGYHDTASNAANVAPTPVNFATAGKLVETLLALNTNVNANSTWDGWVAQGGKPVLTQFATIDTTPDTSWYDANESTYYLMDAGDLAGLATLVNGDPTVSFAGKTINLVSHINFNSGDATTWGTNAPANAWTPIGVTTSTSSNSPQSFQGIFDGNGMTISGLYTKSNGISVGMFANTKDSEIKNFRLVNSYFESTLANAAVQIGTIAAYGDGVFENIYTNAIIVGKGQRNAGIIGAIQDGTNRNNNNTRCIIRNCWYDGTINVSYTTNTSCYSGGITGFALHGVNTMENCLFTGTINYTNTVQNKTFDVGLGSLCGGANANTLTMTNCLSVGKMNVTKGAGSTLNRMGSIIGSGNTNTPVISGCVYVVEDCYDGALIGRGGFSISSGAEVGEVTSGDTTIKDKLGNAWEINTTALENKYKVILSSLKNAIAE